MPAWRDAVPFLKAGLCAWLVVGTVAPRQAFAASIAEVSATGNLAVNPDFTRTYPARRIVVDPAIPNAYVPGHYRILPGFEGEPFMPYGWMIIPSGDKVGTASLVEEAGGKALRIRTGAGETVTLQQTEIEVIPEVSYTWAVSVKGRGVVEVDAYARNPGPHMGLGSARMQATSEWKQVGFAAAVGVHRHLACSRIRIGENADLLLRQAQIRSEPPVRAPAEALVTTKPQPDGDTLFFEDFDGERSAVELGENGRLTEPGDGRFGRGLRVTPVSGGAKAPLSFGNLPESGTIEFWFKPESLPEKPNRSVELLYLNTRIPNRGYTAARFALVAMHVRTVFGFRTEQWKGNYAGDSGAAWGWWQPGTWHHVAGSWDRECIRVYVDGVLEGVLYGATVERPNGEAVDLLLPAAGVVDEIRVSKGLRFGPFVPNGMTNPSWLAGQAAPAGETVPPGPYLETSAKDLDEQRRARLSPIPDARAAYVFGADAAKPAWEGGTRGTVVKKDYFGEGADGVEFQADWPEYTREILKPSAVYWKLDDIVPGKYTIGFWQETQDSRDGVRTEYEVSRMLTAAYLNGWPVRFATSSDPVQVAPGVWLAELQSAEAVDLKPGDELAIRTRDRTVFYRLALHRDEPTRGHGVTGMTFGSTVQSRMYPRLGLSVQTAITGTGVAGAEHEASIRVANPLPYAARAIVDWTLADFYGAPVVSRLEEVMVAPHAVTALVHRFTAASGAEAYQLDAKTRPAAGFRIPFPRPTEWLELNDWTTLAFLPNLPGPLEAWDHARLDLREDAGGRRPKLALSGGGWDRAPFTARRLPEAPPRDLAYEPWRIPDQHYSLPQNVFGYWYRKTFSVPKWMRGQTVELDVRRAHSEGTVYLNGRRIPWSRPYQYDTGGGATENHADITAALDWEGVNELVILVRGYVALMKDEHVDAYNPPPNRDQLDHPGELSWSQRLMLEAVWLRALPALRVEQTLVLPEVDNQSLVVLSRLRNLQTVPATVELSYGVFQAGKPVAKALIPPQRITLKPGEWLETRAHGSSRGLRLYTPEDPVLAQLVSTIRGPEGVLDSQAIRFGYRSLKVGKSGLELNGRPASFLGMGPNYGSQTRLEREDGMRMMRMTVNDPLVLDEIGLLRYTPVLAIKCESWASLKNERLWERARDNAVENVWTLGSRPSLVGWVLENETYFYAPYSIGLEGQSLGGERFASVAGAIRERIWPDFWFLSDGNDSLGGRLDFCSWHYLNHFGVLHGYSAAERGFHGQGQGVSHYPPDCFFLDGAASPPRPDTVVRGPGSEADHWTYGSKACGATEEFWFTDRKNGVPLCKYIGEGAAVSPACHNFSSRGMWWTRLAMQGYRDMRANVLGIYPVSALCLSAQAVTFAVPRQETRCYGGSAVERRVTIMDCEFAPGKLAFAWRLRGADGKVHAGDTLNMKSDTDYLARKRIAFKAPKVVRRTRYVLDMELSKNGRVREHERRVVDVWPAAAGGGAPAAAGLAVALFDPEGRTRAVLERFGCAVTPIPALTTENLTGIRCLIVGPDCGKEEMPAEREVLRAFAAAGGRVLILPQSASVLLPADTYIEPRHHASMGFVRAANHPVLRGLTDADFAMWNPGHLIARGLYRTPNRGNFLPLIEAGHEDLAWTPLLEIYAGKGAILATQLPLVTHLESEPMAAELWRRILSYLKQEVYRSPSATLAVLDGASAPVLRRLQELRADSETVQALDARLPVALVEMNRPDFGRYTEVFRDYVQNGGTLVLHRARPEHAAWLAALTGRRIAVEIQPYRAWVDRQVVMRRDGLAEGLNHVDFHWKPALGGDSMDSQNQVSLAPAEGKEQVEYLVRGEGIVDYLFPGGWTEIPMGRGRVVIDQLKWELPEKEKIDYGSPMRVASMLLSNLGVAQRPPTPKLTLPKGVRHEPVNLAAWVNRGLTDEKAGDGIGWKDWGPGQDLRDFVTGDIVCNGVPFRVAKGDLNAVVLRCSPDYVKSAAEFPERISIPVGRKQVAGLWFLHTGGWTGGLKVYGWREIRYADGSRAKMALNGSNMGDWNYGRDAFPDEEGSATTVAWKGACKMYPVTRVYMTLWINPHPEKEVKEVVLTTEGLPLKECRFLAHLAMTTALLPGAAEAAPARDTGKSLALLGEALALKQAGKAADAVSKLEAAVRADDRNAGAWMELTTLRSATDNREAFMALCRRWIQAIPGNYQAHNQLGLFLEKHDRLQEALAEFKTSLELEGNQPPAIQAIDRIEKRLGQRQ